jgi:DNA-binding transcriptional LysR family regulator
MSRSAFDGVVAPALATFKLAYPEVEIEIDIESRLVDIAEHGFDAGLRAGDLLAKDMTATKVHVATCRLLVASPAYLAARPAPVSPCDLLDHAAILCRTRPERVITPWLLQAGEERFRVDPRNPMIAGDPVTQIELTVRGHGITCVSILSVQRLIDEGRLVRVLPRWSVPLDPVYIYYPSRTRQSAALRALVAHLRRRYNVQGPNQGRDKQPPAALLNELSNAG